MRKRKTSTICSKVEETHNHTSSNVSSHREIKRGSIIYKKSHPQCDLSSEGPLNSNHKKPMIHTHVDYNRLLEEEERRIQEEE